MLLINVYFWSNNALSKLYFYAIDYLQNDYRYLQMTIGKK